MPQILLKERCAFRNADTGGAWLSSAHAIRCWAKPRNDQDHEEHSSKSKESKDGALEKSKKSCRKRDVDGYVNSEDQRANSSEMVKKRTALEETTRE
ncbi:hypothetical protein NL676_005451 [Syzygium grande]|nr:hypothetical protein NL676_005451 [Syzygium grande]